jgi:hypothetical protein
LENELLNDINQNSSLRKDKYLTPNINTRSKVPNKLSGAAYSAVNNHSSPYYHERNNTIKSSNPTKRTQL